jgi:hypothetical protein
MPNKRENRRAHDIAEEGPDRITEGNENRGRQMIEVARKRDPEAVDLAAQVERDREQAKSFSDKK